MQTRPKKKFCHELFDRTVLSLYFAGSGRGGAQLRGGLWGRVSARCNRIVRGGHRALCRTHVWPETQTPKSRSHVMCTFWGGSTYKLDGVCLARGRIWVHRNGIQTSLPLSAAEKPLGVGGFGSLGAAVDGTCSKPAADPVLRESIGDLLTFTP